MTKQEIQAILDHFPDPVDTEQLMQELYLKAKLDRAEAAVARDEVVPQEDVMGVIHGSRDLSPILEGR